MKNIELIGRDDGFSAVASLRAECRARGDAEMACIAGRPGIGKTALLDAILASTTAETIRIHAEPSDERSPYTTLGRLLRAADADVGKTLRREPGNHDTSMTRRMNDVLRGRNNTVVVIDDAQWVDEHSLRIIAGGAERHTFGMLLVAERDGRGQSRPWSKATVRLDPLQPATAEQLARRIVPRAPAAAIEDIVRAAAGVPFGIVLLARALREKTRASMDILSIVARRLGKESPLAEELARLIAAYGGPAPISSLALACGVETYYVAAALGELSDLIAADGETARFRHHVLIDLVRAYDPTAAITARRVFDVERKSPDGSAPGLRRLRDAARRCGEQHTFVETSIALGTRLSESNEHREAALVLGELWNQHRQLGGQIVREYLDALRVLGRDEEAVRIGRIAFHEALARNDGLSAARIAGAVVHGLATLDRDVEIVAFLVDAASRPAIAGSETAMSYLHGVALSDAAFDGDVAKYDALSAIAPLESRDLRADAYVRALRGDAEGSNRSIAQWRASHGNWPVWDDSLEVHRRLFLGGPAACETWFEMLGRTRIERHLNAAAGVRTRMLHLLATGRWDEARAAFDSVDAFQEPAEYRFMLFEMRLMLDALRAEAPRDGRQILEELRAARSAGRCRSVWATAVWWAAAHVRSGDSIPDDIASFITNRLQSWPRPSHLGALPLAAVLIRPKISDEGAAAICAAAPRLGSRWLAAHAWLADALLSQDIDRLRAVRDEFESLAAPAFAMIAGLELPKPRERDETLAQRCGYVGISARQRHVPLSPREREIAELVSSESNDAIAAKLGIATRTVETHLTKIYRKLGIRKRTELASWLWRR